MNAPIELRRPATRVGGGRLSPADLPPTTGHESAPLVLVVDDDPSLCEALAALFRSVGLDAEVFGSTAALLERRPPDVESCLVLDVRLPGASGLDFHAQVDKLYREIPVIFVTGHGDIPMSVRAMKAGAFEFLTKPVRDQDLLEAIQRALEWDRARRNDEQTDAGLRATFDTLTAREREIMTLVVAGRLNKQIGTQIGITEATVKLHRGHVMRKMRAKSLPDLVRMADKLGLIGTKS